jgi:hypothetical protein
MTTHNPITFTLSLHIMGRADLHFRSYVSSSKTLYRFVLNLVLEVYYKRCLANLTLVRVSMISILCLSPYEIFIVLFVLVMFVSFISEYSSLQCDF